MYHMMGLLLAASLATGAGTDAADSDVLGVLEEGYLRNRESFPVIDCRFEYIDGKAATVDDALAGHCAEKRVMQRGHWQVNGTNVRYELVCEPDLAEEAERITREYLEGKIPRKPLASVPGGIGFIPLPCIPPILLRNGSHTLTYAPGHLAGNLFAKTDRDVPIIRITPFSPDHFGHGDDSGPALYLRFALAGRCKARFEGTKRINGTDVLVVRVGPNLDRMFGFDPARGYLLVYSANTSAKSGKRYYEAYVTDAREYSRGRWFPMRTVTIRSPDTPAPFLVKELSVVDLDVDDEPPMEQFRLELASRTKVVQMGRVDYVTLSRPEAFGVDELAALDERCLKRGQEREIDERKNSQADEGDAAGDRSGGRAVLLVACLVLAVATAWLVILNRRR